ncbi:ER-golgi trafficking TRAPP I complex 85 kDa subunit-domain-containing protein [Lipomyces arxii]|uniref:ER-golgi trafficking TRAPP I complex 85 kDa subunit-domain-containing protein n=1 Tax=Lipomyces arxii TaxID=56418 RepID=UPI0034CD6D32
MSYSPSQSDQPDGDFSRQSADTKRQQSSSLSPSVSSSPAPSLSLSFSSFLTGGTHHPLSATGPLSPNNAVSPSHLSAVAALIAQSFAPRVAVFASPDADDLAREKGLPSLLELLRPFSDTVSGPIHLRDAQGIASNVDDFGFRFVSPAASVPQRQQQQQHQQPLSPSKKPAQTSSSPPCFDLQDLDALLDAYLDKGPRYYATDATGSAVEPHDGLYYKFLLRMFAAPPISPHETFSHPVAALIAITSRNEHPSETLAKLYRAGNELPVPAYMTKDFLRYYLYIHDDDRDDLTRSIAAFERMKRDLGIHCYMIRVRSKPADLSAQEPLMQFAPSVWITAAEELQRIRNPPGEVYIYDSDAQAIRFFIHEFASKSLVPFMERCVATWNEQVLANRRGITGRLFSASKRFLSAGNRTTTATTAPGNYDSVTGTYGYMTAEAQMRKLADYTFMLRDWKLANSTYDILRKDFMNDKAWKYHAGAQEMAAASLIFAGTPLTSKTRAETIEPLLDSATYSYISRCAQPTYALRTILISSELLRSRGGGAADDAARWLMKAVSEKLMGNLAHALVIERVSACYSIRTGQGSQGWGNRRRKAAFWQLVAAKEWVMLDKKAHARACLDEAGENVYDALDWTDEPGALLFELRHATESMVYDSSM